MTTWNERLKEAMQNEGVGLSGLSRATGVSTAAVKKWVDGLTLQPKYEDVISACKALKVTPEWLMDGVEAVPQIVDDDEESGSVTLEMVDIKGSCGFGIANWESVPHIRKIQVSRSWFEQNFPYANIDSIKVITAAGDSMEPLIRDRDAVFLDISDTELLREGVYALLMDGELYIKRLQRMPRQALRLKSDNAVYDPIDIPADSDIEVRIIGRVVKAMRIFSI